MNVKIVIGSNYGDEGKGLASRYFAQKAEGSCLTVLHNGGAQRGHTVDYLEGKRFVYHHLACGTADGSDTYFEQNFIVNPILFNREVEELEKVGIRNYSVFISPHCRVTTPYDMILNQMVEQARGGQKHGSCGVGIFETIKRYESSEYNKTFSEMKNMTDLELFRYIEEISKAYLFSKIEEYKIPRNISDDYLPSITSRRFLSDYIIDFRLMASEIAEAEPQNLYGNYNTLIFEGAQGLALDMDNKENFPYLTPSKTGCHNPWGSLEKCGEIPSNIELCYVTRTYFTRHGAGPFPTECKKEEINEQIEDKTNVPNPYQDSIRYGKFDITAFLNRVKSDEATFPYHHTSTCFITHNNYVDFESSEVEEQLTSNFHFLYFSRDKFGRKITTKRGARR